MTAFQRALFTQIILAIAATALTHASWLLSGKTFDPFLLGFIGVASLLTYRIAWYGLPLKESAVRNIDRFIFPTGVIVLIWLLRFISFREIVLLSVCFSACIAYFFQWKRWKGLRTLTYVKSIWLALVWAVITVVVPLNDWNLQQLMIRFLFMLSICIIYNLRDVNQDADAGVKTIPHLLGTRFTKVICLVLLFIAAVMVYTGNFSDHAQLALIVSIALTGLIVLFARENGHWMYYTLLVDGSMIMQYLLLLVFV